MFLNCRPTNGVSNVICQCYSRKSRLIYKQYTKVGILFFATCQTNCSMYRKKLQYELTDVPFKLGRGQALDIERFFVACSDYLRKYNSESVTEVGCIYK